MSLGNYNLTRLLKRANTVAIIRILIRLENIVIKLSSIIRYLESKGINDDLFYQDLCIMKTTANHMATALKETKEVKNNQDIYNHLIAK